VTRPDTPFSTPSNSASPSPDAPAEPADQPADNSENDSEDDSVTGDDTNDTDQDGGNRRDGEYEHLVPLLAEFADLETGDPRRDGLRDELVKGYLPVAQHIARRFSNRGEPMDDLVQVATVGLINAVDRFRPDRGSDFFSFAVPTISGEVRRHFRDQGWSMRVPRRLKDLHVSINSTVSELSHELGRAPRPSEIAAKLDVPVADVLEGLEAAQAYRSSSLDEMLTSEDGGATLGDLLGEADAQLERVEYQQALEPLLGELPDRERTIVMLRFFGNLTQTQIADRVGISQMHVSRLLAQTLVKLRHRLEAE
jgi:RNA polymerase sigma-B factor